MRKPTKRHCLFHQVLLFLKKEFQQKLKQQRLSMDQGRVLEGLPTTPVRYFPIKGNRTLIKNTRSASTILHGNAPIHEPTIWLFQHQTAQPSVAQLATSRPVEIEQYRIHSVYANQLRPVLTCGVFKQGCKTSAINGELLFDAYRTELFRYTKNEAVFYFHAPLSLIRSFIYLFFNDIASQI